MTPDRIAVERIIDAPAADIFALLSDAARHSEFDGSGTVRGTRQSSRPLTLGTRFGMSMHMGVGYKTSNEVVEFEPDRRIAWRTTGLYGLVGGRVWRYELEPIADGGTRVVETWDVTKDRQRFFLKRSKMPAMAKNGMRKTLDRIAQTLEGATP
jgi:uncharacterized protein YndB with AHSA1/START domain